MTDEIRNSNARAVIIKISDETLNAVKFLQPQNDWLEDLDLLPEWIEGPSYIIYFADEGVHGISATTNSLGNKPFFEFTYVPDASAVRDKMLYASTKSTLLKHIGTPLTSIFGSLPKEFNKKAYQAHIASEAAKPPLTEDEKLKNQVRAEEAIAENSIGSRKLHASGISFPLHEDVVVAISEISEDGHPTTGAIIVIEEEEFRLASKTDKHYKEYATHVPNDLPSFALVKGYPEEQNVAFVYVCPQSSNVKHRMLYASSKAALVDLLTTAKDDDGPFGLTIIEKSEVETFEEWLSDVEKAIEAKEAEAANPTPAVKRFARPAKPGKGPARLV